MCLLRQRRLCGHSQTQKLFFVWTLQEKPARRNASGQSQARKAQKIANPRVVKSEQILAGEISIVRRQIIGLGRQDRNCWQYHCVKGSGRRFIINTEPIQELPGRNIICGAHIGARVGR